MTEPATNPAPLLITPDREFRQRLLASGGEDLKQCFQCATCSVVCDLADAERPFPRRQLLWAQWGLKDRLLSDVDIWRCHQCNDCSQRCPRGARPSDVMAAVRREAILHYSAPTWLGRLVSRPGLLPFVLLVPCLLLVLAASVRSSLEAAVGAASSSNQIVISFWSRLPQSLLIAFFAPFVVLELVVIVAGAARLWRSMKARDAKSGFAGQKQPLAASLRSAVRSIVLHEDFDRCTSDHSRMNSHRLVLFGFLGLAAVDLWVLTLRINPLVRDVFVYPLNFWSPWKILANLSGAAMLVGCTLMVRDRFARIRHTGTSFDWMFLTLALAALFTGFGCEIFHYARIDLLRYAAYVVHLSVVFALIILLPYSKFAHAIYRATAIVYAAHTGRLANGGRS